MGKSLNVVNETLFPKGIHNGKECTRWSMITNNYEMKLRYNDMYFYPVIIERYMKESSTGKSKSAKYIIEYVKGHIIEIGQCALESGKKIMKAILDLGVETGEKIIKEVTNYLPMIYNPVRKNFIGETDDESMKYICHAFVGCDTIREVRKVYKRFAKMYHPDSLGRELFPHELLVNEHILKVMRDGVINQIRAYDKVMAEWEDDDEAPMGDLMKMWDITEDDEFINSIWED